ncbi:MAG: hypothetical protein L6Q97_07265 [Thermoanaerobaculia bacterium]|nr:hypothetical protein [Thermoanaerobaculia bacterium]
MKKNQQYYSYSDEPLTLKTRVRNYQQAGRAFLKEALKVEDQVYLNKNAIKGKTKGQLLVLEEEKKVKDLTTVSYRQIFRGIPVWDAAVSILISDSFDIYGASVSIKPELHKQNELSKLSPEDFNKLKKQIDVKFLETALDSKRNALRLKKFGSDLSDIRIKINAIQPYIYQYFAEERQHGGHDEKIKGLFYDIPELQLPEVDKSIKEGAYYGVLEVLFSTVMPWGDLHWRVFIEIKTQSVLYLRILADNINGYVYDSDPVSFTGDTTITPGSAVGILNTARTPRPLPGIFSNNPQPLSGNYVALAELLNPVIPPPTLPLGQDFNFNANTPDFTAVNAYYHNDALFRMVEEMGFDMNAYFDGTMANPGFPVPVDHRSFFDMVNACAPGNMFGNGSGGFHYGLVESGQPVGIACCWSVVLHEFGHAILWDNVHSPNFGFAHSAGDSLAAILNDPRSKAPDRFMTFPWLTLANPGIDRRHDRDVATGWAWGGVNDDGGYGSEQILSTSHFRVYRSLGGDHSDLLEREFAARYMSYLIFYGVGLLTPATNPNSPEEWAGYLITADLATSNFEGQPRGCVHKVIRWAFEKQGAFQPLVAVPPITTPGAPPAVDVYINDGRNGEYYFSRDIYDSSEIWNRRLRDGNATHQKPLIGQRNFAYVIVHNRGTQTANRVTVRGYRSAACCCGSDSPELLTWPNDFIPMLTPFAGPYVIPSNSYVVAGPFEWIPEQEGEKLLFAADAHGDRSNLSNIPSGESVAVNHFVPFDNNIAIRRMPM